MKLKFCHSGFFGVYFLRTFCHWLDIYTSAGENFRGRGKEDGICPKSHILYTHTFWDEMPAAVTHEMGGRLAGKRIYMGWRTGS